MSDPWPADQKADSASETISVDAWVQLVHPDHREETVAIGERALAGEIPAYSIEYQVKLSTGK